MLRGRVKRGKFQPAVYEARSESNYVCMYNLNSSFNLSSKPSSVTDPTAQTSQPLQPPSASVVPISSEVTEEWIIELREFLEKRFERTGHESTVQLWLEFEKLSNDRGMKKTRLAGTGRPPALKAWQLLPRQLSRPPPLGKLTAYSKMWNEWWRALQPGWRVGTEGRMVTRKTPDETWRDLMKAGENGFSFLLLSLAWWIEQVKTKSERSECLRALKDVSWVLLQMVERLRETEIEIEDDSGRYQKRCVFFWMQVVLYHSRDFY